MQTAQSIEFGIAKKEKKNQTNLKQVASCLEGNGPLTV